ASGATAVGASTNVTASFSEPLDPASVTPSTFQLRGPDGAPVSAATTGSGATITLDSDATLTGSTTYTATVKGGPTGVKDVAGNPLAADYSWSFTTAAPVACPCSLFSSVTVPTTPATADTGAFELGVRFQSDVDGYGKGIPCSKAAGT